MTPESITTSLEMSKKLKEAGWQQEESHFTWVDSEGDISLHCGDFEWTPRIKATWFQFAAPTAEEILRRLPWKVNYKNQDYYFRAWMDVGNCLHFSYQPKNGLLNLPLLLPDDGDMMGYVDRPDANAAAAMWIYLKENNLLPSD